VPNPALLIALFALVFAPFGTAAATTATQWSSSHKSKARLLAGTVIAEDGSRVLYAAIEITLTPKWKTYWRHPGEAGGVPPYLDWSKSTNLAGTELLFPAPQRFKDTVGDAIGYEKHVVLPVRITLLDPAKPVSLAVDFQYGVCLDICIPARAKLALPISPSHLQSTPPQLAAALQRIPTAKTATSDNHPSLKRVELRTKQAAPEIIIDARFPLGLKGADLFVETLDDIYLPMTKRVAQPAPDVLRYRIDLADGADLGNLAGRKVRFTLVSDAGSAEIEHTLR